jgi:hypothetical protein
MRRRLWAAVGAAVVLLGAGTFYLMLPELGHGEPARPARCMSNLNAIGIACRLYAEDRGGAYPPSLGALFPDYAPSGNLFLCPVAPGSKPITHADLPPGADDAADVFTEENSDYAYVAGFGAGNPKDLVLAHDKDGNHEGGRNVLLVGNNVEWMKEEEFQAALKRTRDYLREKERPGAE